MMNANPDDEEPRVTQMRERLIQQLKNYGLIQSATVEQAFRAVPRHLFLPGIDIARVYSDTAIATKVENGVPISSSSQPAIMASMLEQLDVQPGQRILEIGTGTGYNAALLAYMVGPQGRVTTIDIDRDTVISARQHLSAAGFGQVRVLLGDGGMGVSEMAPYDRIILTVGADDITQAWREQLVAGGKLVLPFKLTQFHSILALHFDQVSLALQRVDDYLVSYSMYAAGFMPLRGSYAVQQRRAFLLDKGLTFTSNRSISQHTTTLLRRSYHDRVQQLEATLYELWGLHLWLILQEPDYCEIQRKNTDQQYQYVPSLDGQGRGSGGCYGLFSERGISLLYREQKHEQSADDRRTKVTDEDETEDDETQDTGEWQDKRRLVVRHFGDDEDLARHFEQSIMAWDKEGRPFRWSFPQAINNLTIRVYPSTRAYTRTPHELTSPRKGSLFVFSW